MDKLANQLRAAGWTDETKISQQIVKEEKGLVRNALADYQSPAKPIFEMAKSAVFIPKPRAAAPVPGTPLDGNLPARSILLVRTIKPRRRLARRSGHPPHARQR